MGKRKKKPAFIAKYGEIADLAADMVKELETHHGGEKNWKMYNPGDFFSVMEMQMVRLEQALWPSFEREMSRDNVRKRCAHVANYAMMIHDLAKERDG